jgi:hypothetical protein
VLQRENVFGKKIRFITTQKRNLLSLFLNLTSREPKQELFLKRIIANSEDIIVHIIPHPHFSRACIVLCLRQSSFNLFEKRILRALLSLEFVIIFSRSRLPTANYSTLKMEAAYSYET